MITFTFNDRNVDLETYTNAKSPDAQVSKSQHSASVCNHNSINLRIISDLESARQLCHNDNVNILGGGS